MYNIIGDGSAALVNIHVIRQSLPSIGLPHQTRHGRYIYLINLIGLRAGYSLFRLKVLDSVAQEDPKVQQEGVPNAKKEKWADSN